MTQTESLYEQFNSLSNPNPKLRFWEWFSGDVLNSFRWTVDQIAGSNTVQLSDTIDGGLEIITGTGDNNSASISFGGSGEANPFHHQGCVDIAVWEITNGTTFHISSGFSRDFTYLSNGGTSYAGTNMDTDGTFAQTVTYDGTTQSGTDTDIRSNISKNIIKTECNTSDVTSTINYRLANTKATNSPINPMQPIFRMQTRSAATKTSKIYFKECFNT